MSMGLHDLKNWGHPEEDSYGTPAGYDFSGNGKQERFGREASHDESALDSTVTFLTKLLMLAMLILCLIVMGLCARKLSTSLMPAMKKAICEAPAAAAK